MRVLPRVVYVCAALGSCDGPIHRCAMRDSLALTVWLKVEACAQRALMGSGQRCISPPHSLGGGVCDPPMLTACPSGGIRGRGPHIYIYKYVSSGEPPNHQESWERKRSAHFHSGGGAGCLILPGLATPIRSDLPWRPTIAARRYLVGTEIRQPLRSTRTR